MSPVGRRFSGGRAYMAAIVLVAALVMGGWFVQRGTRDARPSLYQTVRLFEEVRQRVLRDFVDSLSEDDVYRKAVDGVLHELNDPYTRFLPAERLERLSEATSGNYVGIGLQVDVHDGWVLVMAPRPGGPAERAGLQPGDRILEINGRSAQQLTLEEANNALRGPIGSRVTLLIDRVAAPYPFRVTLTRARVHVSAVRQAEMLTSEVGYVELRAFNDSTTIELERAIDRLRSRGMRSLVLDLRMNPGGLMEQGVRVADLFLDRGALIVRTTSRTPEESRDHVGTSPQRWPDLPLTLLVDGRSASATEIVAGALQDHDRAAIVGTPTYGKGSAQAVFHLSGGGLKLTTTRWYTPIGRSIMRRASRETDFGPIDPQPRERPRFRTLGGRTVRGGGGIVPDMVVGDTVMSIPEAALNAAVAGNAQAYRSALADAASEIRRRRLVDNERFVVTEEMLDLVAERLQARGVRIPRLVFEDAAPIIARTLSYEVARLVFGPQAEFRRRATDDTVVQAAVQVAQGATSPKDPLRRVSRLLAEQGAELSG